jgi:anti-sigma factor RsiW
MCPDPQVLSIYVDGELPSPWKEKLETHLKGCPLCREKYENFRQLHELFKKDTTAKRVYIERIIDEPAGLKNGEERTYTESEMQEAKERIWNKINDEQQSSSRNNKTVWHRRLSVPLPAAAAAAIIIMLAIALLIRGETFLQTGGFAGRQPDSSQRVDFIIAAEEEMPSIIPAADLSGVIQYLTSDGTDIIILRLPESRSFSRTGEPAMIRAADYRAAPQMRRQP